MKRLIDFINEEFGSENTVDNKYQKFSEVAGVSKRTVYLSVKKEDHYIVVENGCYNLIKLKKEFTL